MKILKLYDRFDRMSWAFNSFVNYNSATIEKVEYKSTTVTFKNGAVVFFKVTDMSLSGVEVDYVDLDSCSNFSLTEVNLTQSRIRGSKPASKKLTKRTTTTVEETFE